MSGTYTTEDIIAHNKKGDLWIAIGDHVYDISQFVNDHPGGEEILLDVGGRDATKDFEDVGHSPDAHNIMKKYLVGDFKSAPRQETKKPVPTKAPPKVQKPDDSGSKMLLVPLLILLIAAVAYFSLSARE